MAYIYNHDALSIKLEIDGKTIVINGKNQAKICSNEPMFTVVENDVLVEKLFEKYKYLPQIKSGKIFYEKTKASAISHANDLKDEKALGSQATDNDMAHKKETKKGK